MNRFRLNLVLESTLKLSDEFNFGSEGYNINRTLHKSQTELHQLLKNGSSYKTLLRKMISTHGAEYSLKIR